MYPIYTDASLANKDAGLATFLHLSKHLTARAKMGHATPIYSSRKLIKLTIITINGSGKVSGVESN